MPRDPFKPLTVPEQRFVIHYLREGATPEVAYIAERKARLKKGEASGFLRRKHVLEEIARRQRLVEFEENRLIAKEKIGLAQQAEERDRVTLDKIEGALDKVIKLDPEKHGGTVLEAIRLGLVYTGTIRDGRRERVIPPDPAKAESGDVGGSSFYQSIFSDLRSGDAVGPGLAAAAPEPAPLMPEDDRPKPPPTIPVVRTAAAVAAKPAARPDPRQASPAKKNTTLDIEIT